MRDIKVTAYYRDGTKAYLRSFSVKYLGYKRDGERPIRYDTHTVLDKFELEFLRNSANGYRSDVKWIDTVNITKEPDGFPQSRD